MNKLLLTFSLYSFSFNVTENVYGMNTIDLYTSSKPVLGVGGSYKYIELQLEQHLSRSETTIESYNIGIVKNTEPENDSTLSVKMGLGLRRILSTKNDTKILNEFVADEKIYKTPMWAFYARCGILAFLSKDHTIAILLGADISFLSKGGGPIVDHLIGITGRL